MKFKEGDKVYCHTDFISITGNRSTTAGKYYKIRNIILTHGDFNILDDNRQVHYFSFNTYNKWLYTEKELRKLKLDKLNETK